MPSKADAELTEPGLTGLGVAGIQPSEVTSMDSIKAMPMLAAIGDALAHQVDLTHLGPFADVPLEVA